MEAIGAPQEQIDKARAFSQPVDEDFEVDEENWDAVLFFLRLSGQWNVVAGMGGIVHFGLLRNCVEAEMNMCAIPRGKRKKLNDQLLIMEQAALTVLNKKEG